MGTKSDYSTDDLRDFARDKRVPLARRRGTLAVLADETSDQYALFLDAWCEIRAER